MRPLVFLVAAATLTWASAAGAHAAPAAVSLPLVEGTPCSAGEQTSAVVDRSTDAPNVPLDGTVVVSPDRIETVGPLAPGTVMTCTITIRSRHPQRATFALVPYGLVGNVDASISYVDPDAPGDAGEQTAGSWLEPAVTEIAIPPRGVARVPVIVRVPQDPPDGSAYASLNIVPRAGVREAEGTDVSIETQVGLPLLLQTGEGRAHIELRDVSAPRVRWSRQSWTLRAEAHNRGSLHGTARGRVRVRSIFGNEVARLPVVTRPLLPGASAPVEVTWRGVPWLGLYRTELRTDGAADPVRGWFVALPPWWLLALVAGLLALWIVWDRVRRRRGNEQELLEADDDADGTYL